jgi:hypothetical protein
MTRSSSTIRRRCFSGVCTGIFVMSAVMASAAPAWGQHHARKPHKLWHQYPLKVQGPTPSTRPSSASSPPPSTSSSSAKSRPASSGTTGARSKSEGLSTGKLFVLGGAAILLAALFLLVRRAQPTSPKLPERGVRPARADTGDDLDRSENGYKPAVIETPTEPSDGAAASRVRLQLEDGRSLEGFARESGSTNTELVILDVVAAFDPNGNDEAPRPSDSFILRSEIASMQRLDDP